MFDALMPNAEMLPLMQGIAIKILPLYFVMALGFFFGRLRPTAVEPLSFLQIYFIVPVVVVSSIANLHFQSSYLLLPVITFIGCTIVALAAYMVGKTFWKDSTANIFSYACGCANIGYFGVPVALILFPPGILGLFMIMITGFTLFESSLGYYLVARGNFTVRDSLKKLVRLPLVYAFLAGLTLSILGLHVPEAMTDITRDFRGFYVVAGALMIGLGLSRLKKLEFEFGLIAYAFAFKFLLWPLLALGAIAFDVAVTHLFTAEIHKIILLAAIMPLPANAVAFALQLNVHPERASTLVFLSTVFALFYVPFVMALWG
jgi:predicted permease